MIGSVEEKGKRLEAEGGWLSIEDRRLGVKEMRREEVGGGFELKYRRLEVKENWFAFTQKGREQ